MGSSRYSTMAKRPLRKISIELPGTGEVITRDKISPIWAEMARSFPEHSIRQGSPAWMHRHDPAESQAPKPEPVSFWKTVFALLFKGGK
jgi:hypothetical protein